MPEFELSPQMQEALLADRHPDSLDKLSNVFKWTTQRKTAAALFAAGEPKKIVCEKAKVTDATLNKWLKIPEFMKRVEANRKAIQQELVRTSIGNRVRRLQHLQDRHDKLNQVIEERSQADCMQEVAGGKTGLLARDVKAVGQGRDRQLVEVFNVDTGLLKEMREIEKQAAIECGQWNENTSPLTQEQEAVHGFHLTVEDRRTFIVAICSELGIPIDPKDFAGTPLALSPSLEESNRES